MVDVLARASTALLGIQDVGAVLIAIVEAAGHAVPVPTTSGSRCRATAA